MTEAAEKLLAHARGEHRTQTLMDCPACQNIEAAAAMEAKPARVHKPGKKERRGSGMCEHCGCPTGGRFAPGHDAKLKSELAEAAKGGNAMAWAEIMLRGWARLVSDAKRPPAEVIANADQLVSKHGYALVEKRVLIRQSAASAAPAAG